MSKLLIDEHPLIVLPSLAAEFGLHEALILQQIHYWLEHVGPDGRRYGRIADDQRWIRNTVEQWQETNFPFLSVSQIYRYIKSLEQSGVVVSRQDLNKIGYDRTKWYTIDYSILQNREMEFALAQNRIRGNEETIPETTIRDHSQKEEELSPAFSEQKPTKAKPKLAQERRSPLQKLEAQAPTSPAVDDADPQTVALLQEIHPDLSKLTVAHLATVETLIRQYGPARARKHLSRHYADWCGTKTQAGAHYNPSTPGWIEWAEAEPPVMTTAAPGGGFDC